MKGTLFILATVVAFATCRNSTYHDKATAICAEPNSDWQLAPHEDCQKFYMCRGGVPMAHTCTHNDLFDAELNSCHWPARVVCGNRHIQPSTAPFLCNSRFSDDIVIPHENCNKYYRCSNGAPVADSCPPSTLYDPVSQQCRTPWSVDCGERIIEIDEARHICATPASDGILVASSSCNGFVVCRERLPVQYECDMGQRYNPQKKICDWPERIPCDQ